MEARQVGLLVRNASGLFDLQKHPDMPKRFPKIPEVIDSYQVAGDELASLGRIRWRTQQKANREIVPVPFFWLLKRIIPIKRRVVSVLNDPDFW
jgi:hypothetical protein